MQSRNGKKGIWYAVGGLTLAVAVTLSLFGNGLLLQAEAAGCTVELFSGEPRTEEVLSPVRPMDGAPDVGSIGVADDVRVWESDTQVDIFRVSYTNGAGEITAAGGSGRVIAPGTENTYCFRLKNNTLNYGDYSLTLEAFFTGNDGVTVPVEARLNGAGGYLYGDETQWLPVEGLNGLADSGTLGAGSMAEYTLEWRWPFESGQDETDTLLGIRSAASDITLTIRILTDAVAHDPETDAVLSPIPSVFNGVEHFAYLRGYPDGTIRPLEELTRAQAAVIFDRLLKYGVREQYAGTACEYTDVADGTWYTEAVQTLSAMQVLRGYPDGSFRPNDTVRRSEFAAMCARFADVQTVTGKTSFTDISGHWSEKEVTLCEENGWVRGRDDGGYHPDETMTRAEAVTVINRMLHRLPEQVSDLHEDMTVWTDNADENAWYYIAIQEASNGHDYVRGMGTDESWTVLKETEA